MFPGPLNRKADIWYITYGGDDVDDGSLYTQRGSCVNMSRYSGHQTSLTCTWGPLVVAHLIQIHLGWIKLQIYLGWI